MGNRPHRGTVLKKHRDSSAQEYEEVEQVDVSEADELDDQQMEEEGEEDEQFWVELVSRIKAKRLIPIISNSVRNNYILDTDFDGNVDEIKIPGADELTISEELAQEWAKVIGYPLPDKFKLARVAQYHRLVKCRTDEFAKSRYLRFLKKTLLDIASADKAVTSVIEAEEMKERLDSLSFSHIVHELGYPKFNDVHQDSLRLLARLPLPIYLTTSYYTFLERVLQAEGKIPQTQVCFWSGEPPDNLRNEHRPDPNFKPSVARPLVFHLYGLEDYPESLVLSEDDYLDFLVEFSKQLSDNRILPPYLRGNLSRSSLLLLGFRLQDWDFRILFRGVIISAQEVKKLGFNVAIQFDPDQQSGVENGKIAQTYLERYFGKADFEVKWGNSDSFIKRLSQAWQESGNGG
jgi:hypothetical protein